MTVTKEKIEELRNILLRAKAVAYREEMNDFELFQQCLYALTTIAYEGIYELKQELYDLLNIGDEIIRADIVATLGYNTRLGLPEFQLKAYDIWLNDPSNDVKFSALGSWATYYIDTQNKDVILILYKILTNKKNNFIIRESAYDGILSTVDYSALLVTEPCRPTSYTEEEFQAHINWNKLNKVLVEYVPEVFEGNLPVIEEEDDNNKTLFKVFTWAIDFLLYIAKKIIKICKGF